MWFLALFIVPLLVNSADAISACNVCGIKSGVMCHDATTFSFCDGGRPLDGRHSCPSGMICMDSFAICANSSSIAKGTPICESECGKCTHKRFACKSRTTFSLCFGSEEPTSIVYKCPTNKICSSTMDANSTDFCYDPVRLSDEDISCFEAPTTVSVVSPMSAPLVASAPPAPVE